MIYPLTRPCGAKVNQIRCPSIQVRFTIGSVPTNEVQYAFEERMNLISSLFLARVYVPVFAYMNSDKLPYFYHTRQREHDPIAESFSFLDNKAAERVKVLGLVSLIFEAIQTLKQQQPHPCAVGLTEVSSLAWSTCEQAS